MKSKSTLLLVLLSILIFSLSASAATVEVAEVVQGDMSITELITGTIRPYQEISIPAQIGGVAESVNVNIGDRVKKGELLISINKDKLLVQKKQAEAALESARASYQELVNGATEEALQRAEASYQQAKSALESAETNYQLVQKIYEDKTSLKQQLLNAEGQLNNAEQQYKIAEDNLAQAEVNFEQAEKAFERSKKLYEDQVISEKEFEDAESRYKNAQSSLNSARSSLSQAESALENARENYQLSKESFEDPTQLKQQLESARSQVANAESNFKVAEANLAETRRGARPERLRASQAQVKQAEASLEEIKLNLDYAQIESPIDGVVYQVNADQNEIIGSGQPVATVIDLEQLFVEINVTASTVSKINEGGLAPVKAEIMDKEIMGEISQISPSANPQTKSYLVKVKIDNPDKLLKAGMFADVRLETERSENTLIVPIESIVDLSTGNPKLFVVEDSTAQVREVELGLSTDEEVEILSGVSQGEMVIIRGQNRISSGAEVEVINR